MHLGNAWSALLGWLWAKSEGGQFLLRVEDLDPARCRPEHVERLLSDLTYLGLTWEGPVLYQSQRRALYDQALERLDSLGRLYPCTCTRAEVARAALAPHGPGDDGPVYPGTCRDLSPSERAARTGRPFALRFSSQPGEVRFEDAVQGPVSQDVARAVGDFVVRRNDGVASYQLAVVVDDHLSGVTHVLRGDDLLGSTPRQLQLYRALGWPPPRYAHVPLLVGPDGKRLAKREGAFAIADLRAREVPPERVVGLLASWARLGGGEPHRPQDLVARFAVGRLPRAPVVVDEDEVKRAVGLC